MPETHGFKAEVQQLLDLMIKSVYSDNEVFLRELVSNAADALDKVRFEALTRDDLTAPEGDEPAIRVTVDAEKHTVVIEDDGVGMTRDEAIAHLGTIAHSGTASFLARLKEADAADAPSLIGQFGVGFYSSFIVAQEVIVETLSAEPGAEPVLWRSKGEGSYSLEPCVRRHRGTRITLVLREDAHEFADADRLRSIVQRHSNFLQWPVLIDGERANSGKALWAQRPSDVDDDEANQLYRSLSMDWQDPAMRLHVSTDSPIQLHAMLFVPAARPFDLFQPEVERGPRLYARKVLIMEHAADLLPNWLRFVRGVVDSEDIPLNLSREMVQKTPVLRKISKVIVSRLLKDLVKLDTPEADENKYPGVWEDFGVLLKEGFYSAPEWRDKLLPLLRFNATSHEDGEGLISLDAYKAAMPEGQDTIWYITAASRQQALASPHLEALRKRGWDCLVLTDAVDEWLVQSLTEHDGLPVKSIARGELDLDDDAEESEDKADLTGLAPWMQEMLAGDVAGVRASGRLTDSPCVLVDAEDSQISANMERILRGANQDVPSSRRVLELNTRHPLVKNLASLHEQGRTSAAAPIARLLLDDALLLDGTVQEPAAIGRRLQDLLVRASEDALRADPPA